MRGIMDAALGLPASLFDIGQEDNYRYLPNLVSETQFRGGGVLRADKEGRACKTRLTGDERLL